MVELGLVSGKRRRIYVPTAGQAKTELTKVERERKALGDAWDRLDARRKWTVLEVLRDIKKQGLTIEEVWQYYQSHHRNLGSMTIKDSIEKFLSVKAEAGRRQKYIIGAGGYLRNLMADHMDRPIASVRADEVRTWVHSVNGGDWSRHTAKKRFVTFFGWAERQGYIAESPAKNLETISIEHNEPKIFSVGQCRDLIAAARKHDPDMLPYFALAMFQGIRPDECKKLPKSAINLEAMTITVDARSSKTRDRRIVTMIDPAYRILSKARKTANFVRNNQRRRIKLQELAGIKDWPQDVLRHTAASHFYNIYGMDDATKQLGHSAAIMLRHYRQMVSKEETKEWLEI